MSRGATVALAIVLLLSTIGCDQVTKVVARNTLASAPSFSLLHDTVRFELAENPGAFLSLGATLPPGVRRLLFATLAPLFVLGALAVLVRSGSLSTGQLLGAALVAGGGVGNLLDRILNDLAVIDFVSLGIGSFRTGIFNLADVAILAGLAAMVMLGPRGRAPAQKAI